MISKYSLWTSVLALMNILLFSSCLKSTDNNMELPVDPQIYAISVSSKADTSSLLPGVVFTIDQVKGEIFNKKPLPYLFHVDSALLGMSGSNNYYSFTKIELTLDRDCTYIWKSDSIAINRLTGIKTTAPNGVTTKDYTFQLNIYREDPYIINWEKIRENYLPAPVTAQKTIALDNRIFTYYLSGTEMKAVSAPAPDSGTWEGVNLSGMPHTIGLSSLITSGGAVYALDTASGAVYRSPGGVNWSPVQTDYEVVALFSELPSTSSGNILLGVNHNGKLTFAHAGNDLQEITLMNDMPAGMPVTGFSAIKVESSTSFAGKFIFLSGGTKADNTPNNDIWVLQDDGGAIRHIVSKKPAETTLKGGSLFFYDDKPYLITTSAGKNLLLYSDNFGTDWVEAGENQALPADFTGRTNASVITGKDNYIWIFGGISSPGTQLVDIWKGRLNKFASD